MFRSFGRGSEWTTMALIAAIIAFGVALISLQQWLLAKEKFKLDLFEKRFAILKAVESYLSDTIVSRKGSIERVQQFYANTMTANFLFDEDIINFAEKLKVKGLNLKDLDNVIEALPEGDERHEAVRQKVEILCEFLDIQLQLKDKFSPYLKFLDMADI